MQQSMGSPGEQQEYRKMKLFLKSPILYRAAMRLNDSFLIPIKVAMANRRQR